MSGSAAGSGAGIGTGSISGSSAANGTGSTFGSSGGADAATAGTSGSVDDGGSDADATTMGASGSASGGTSDAEAGPEDAPTKEDSTPAVTDASLEGNACTNACTAGATRCASGGGAAQTCTVQANGCTQWVSTTCGTRQTCTGSGGTSACTCASTICTAVANVCQDTQTLASCMLDADGCLYVASTAPCAMRQTCTSASAGAGACTCMADVTCGTNVGPLCLSASVLASCDADPNGCVYEASSSPCMTSDPNGKSVCASNACSLECDSGYTLCGGACVDLQTDNNNCGGCSLTCSTGCSQGLCVVSVGLAAYAGTGGVAFTADATNAYYTQATGGGSGVFWIPLAGGNYSMPNNTGSYETVGQVSASAGGLFYGVQYYNGSSTQYLVFGANIANGTTRTIGTTDSSLAGAIASDANNVYWTNNSTHQLLQAPAAGNGTATVLATGASTAAGGIAVDSSYIYWADTDANAVRKVLIGGGGLTTLTSSIGPTGFIGLESSNLYFASGIAIEKVSVGGGAISDLFSQSFRYAAIDAENFYWATSTQIGSVPLAGGSPQILYTTPPNDAGNNTIFGLAVSGNSVYWTMNSELMKVTPK